VFVGYGWWVTRDLEYLLPTAKNFRDVLRLKPSEVENKKIVLVRSEFFNWEESQDEDEYRATCERNVLLRQLPFVISLCRSLPSELPVALGKVATNVVSGQGVLDIANCRNIAGWAWDTTQPERAVKLDVFDSDLHLATVIAYSFRKDLLEARIGNGRHGFNYVPEAELKSGHVHSIRVKISGSDADISGSPKQFVCNEDR